MYKKRYGRFGRSRKMKGRMAHKAARRAYRKAIRTPKRILAKKYANTVGQITYKSRRNRPSHRRY